MSDHRAKEYAEVGITCLHCGQVQLPPNRDKLDNWSCSYCYSGFLSVAMLSNLVAPREVIAQINRKGSREKAGRPCPHCRAKMSVVDVQFYRKELSLEICRPCRLLWFDSGELLRLLRNKGPEVFVEEEPVAVAAPTTAPRQPAVPPAPRLRFSPRLTYALVAASLLIAPLGARVPYWMARFGFYPARPFAEGGLTWLTSFFFTESAAYVPLTAAVLLLAGGYVEEKLGSRPFLALFAASGLAGRLAYLLAEPGSYIAHGGANDAVAGVVTYCALMFPYRQAFFPSHHRYRSPVNALSWIAVLAVTGFGFWVGCNFIAAALNRVAHGLDATATDPSGTWFAGLRAWMDSGSFRALAAGSAVGFLWYVVVSTTSFTTRPAAPPPRQGPPLRSTRLHP